LISLYLKGLKIRLLWTMPIRQPGFGQVRIMFPFDLIS